LNVKVSQLAASFKATYNLNIPVETSAEDEIDAAYDAATLPSFCYNSQFNLKFSCPSTKYTER